MNKMSFLKRVFFVAVVLSSSLNVGVVAAATLADFDTRLASGNRPNMPVFYGLSLLVMVYNNFAANVLQTFKDLSPADQKSLGFAYGDANRSTFNAALINKFAGVRDDIKRNYSGNNSILAPIVGIIDTLQRNLIAATPQ